jgi:sulfite exporter TauE/SafE
MLGLGLIFSNFMMGLLGGSHCVLMCGPFCRFISTRKSQNFYFYNAGRIFGYGILGGMFALFSNSFAGLASSIKTLHPLWVMMHAFFLIWGIYLIFLKKQIPAFVWISKISNKIFQHKGINKFPIFIIGVFWALMPCGLLYSAYFLALISSQWQIGVFMMIAFGFGTFFPLFFYQAYPFFLKKIQLSEDQSYFISGVIISIISIIALWMDLTKPITIWCQ